LENNRTIYFNEPPHDEKTGIKEGGFLANRGSHEVESPVSESVVNSKKEIKTYDKIKPRRKRRKFVTKVRMFLVKHRATNQLLEFGCHFGGIHLRNYAFHFSETGCINCRCELES